MSSWLINYSTQFTDGIEFLKRKKMDLIGLFTSLTDMLQQFYHTDPLFRCVLNASDLYFVAVGSICLGTDRVNALKTEEKIETK